MNISKITIGTDVEFSIYDTMTGKPIPAREDWFPTGRKAAAEPFYTTSSGRLYLVERDVVNLEFTHDKPYTLNEGSVMYQDLFEVITDADAKLSNYGYSLSTASFTEHSLAILKSRENKIMKYMERGCQPDFNAWMNGEENTINDEVRRSAMFGSGFHIHIGGIEDLPLHDKLNIVKLLDWYVGVYSLEVDSDRKRRVLTGYGKAGSFRFKPYGLEYRVLGTGFITNKSLPILFNKIKEALTSYDNPTVLERLSLNEHFIREAVNNYNIIQ